MWPQPFLFRQCCRIGLENFNVIGSWRNKDGTHPVDSTGQLITGETFTNSIELTNILLERKREEVIRCFANKLLTYGLGRGLEYYDKCALDEITSHLHKNQYRFSELIMAIVNSTPFQKRRGDELTGYYFFLRAFSSSALLISSRVAGVGQTASFVMPKKPRSAGFPLSSTRSGPMLYSK